MKICAESFESGKRRLLRAKRQGSMYLPVLVVCSADGNYRYIYPLQGQERADYEYDLRLLLWHTYQKKWPPAHSHENMKVYG